ncbi:MAG: cupin domain-containing protein [Clostridiales bacterium]|nr:cupin domain-containing protein [Clostridiales bacterium]
MNIILLSGGSGKRLWPLSNDERSKQFIKIFKNDQGQYESMLQRMYRSFMKIDPEAKITIAAPKTQIPSIRNQIGEEVSISTEPCRRDTFPAIVLASAFLHDKLNVDPNETVIVCPVDPYVEEDYFLAVKELDQLVQEDAASLVLLGMQPTYPSEKYGYIIPAATGKISKVETFKEKPDAKTAALYISRGALWNGGVFAYRLGYMLDKAEHIIGTSDYRELYDKYDSLEKISIDYAIVEKEANTAVRKFTGKWKDLGTWNTLTEAMEENTVGDVTISDDCKNVHAINHLGMPLFIMGLHDAVVAACPDGVLVSDKTQSSYIKPYIDKLDATVKVADKHYGNYLVLDNDSNSLTVRISMNAGQAISYHSHQFRDETWTIISGNGTVTLEGEKRDVCPGDVVRMSAGQKHSVRAGTDLVLIEIQLGHDIDSSDITRWSEG